MQCFGMESGPQSGAFNMALDEALLEYCRSLPAPVLVVRTYRWEVPTLSLGVNQPDKDVAALLRLYGDLDGGCPPALVRRPTGGRAILHGEDISFSFVTNDPTLLKQPLKDTYCVLTRHIRHTLEALGIAVQSCEEAGDRDYLRSPVCFETHTASDLVAENGQKLAGSAQLRRAGGLLQHGAAFLKPYGVSESAFASRLFHTVAQAYGLPALADFPLASVRDLLAERQAAYIKESGEILARASTTSGSHLAPASC